MDNKETLQSHNNRLIQNNTDLSEVLDMINNMPEPEPNMQDKTIEITENGTITVTPDGDYDGLSSVEIITNAAEDLTEELTDYNIKVTNQKASISGIITALGKKSSYETYSPTFISFYKYSGTELDERTLKIDTSRITSMASMFYQCTKLTSLNLSGWDTSNVTSTSLMFQSCNKLNKLDVSTWDTSNITNMSSMFRDCFALTEIDVSGWDTSNVTNMSGVFWKCESLTEIDVSGWDTSNVTSMSSLFSNCKSLKNIDISNFNMGKVTDIQEMFAYCTQLTTLDLTYLDVSNIQNMTYLFDHCSNLTEIDLSTWVTTSLTNISAMFRYCTNLKKIDMRNFTFDKVTGTIWYAPFEKVPADCLIIVKDDATKTWVTTTGQGTHLTNVKTVAELEAS